MSQINHITLDKFRKKADSALKQIAKDLGVEFDGCGRITYDSEMFRCKIEFNSKQPRSKQLSFISPTALIGKSFQIKRSIYTVTSYHRNRPKYCLSVVNNRGKRYRVPADYFSGRGVTEVTKSYKNPYVH